MHRRGPSEVMSNSTQDEYDLSLNRHCVSEGWRLVSDVISGIVYASRTSTPYSPQQVAERTARAPQVERQWTRDRSNADATAKMVTRNMLSKQPSAPVVNTERVEAQHNVSDSASFSTSRARARLSSLPRTPTKLTRTFGTPPSTTKAIRTGIDTLGLSTPSKKGKEPSGRSDLRPKQTIFIPDDDDDEDEMNEVSNYFNSFESPPSPRSASPVITSQPALSSTTSSSWSSASMRQESSSWDSVEMPLTTTAGRKRARPSDVFDAEATRTSSISVNRNVLDVSSTLRTPKARKEDRQSSPTKTSLETKAMTARIPPLLTSFFHGEDHQSSPTKTSFEAKPITVSVSNDIPPLVTSFFRDDGLGRALQPHVIAYDHETQRLMDSLNLAWGVQYEIARGVTSRSWTWEDVQRVLREKPTELRGSNADAAPHVRKVVLNHGHLRAASAPLWEELDREQAALLENEGRGLGLMGSWHGQDDWYGGQIQQIASLEGKGSRYVIRLGPMKKQRSHRFSRFCGSRRILQLRIEHDLILKEGVAIKSFLQQKFVLCGRIFVPFHVKHDSGKHHNVYMVETNEDLRRKPSVEAGDNYRISFSEFINWHNPPEYNYKQALSKYVTRFSLGLSTSIPAVEFEARNIFFIDDIYGSGYQGKASAEETMTDGCGLINQAALRAINRHLNKYSLPVAVQGRIAGAKGLWILHPDDTSPDFKIWIRESQNKIKHTQLHRAHRIFELLSTSQPPNAISITTQPIVNLAYNGVPHETLLSWLEKGLVEQIQPLIDWDRPHSAHLWQAIYKAGSIGRSRLARLTPGLSRAKGFTKGSWKDDEFEQIIEVDSFEDAANTSGERNQYSGAPFVANEFTLELLQAGFHPRHSAVLKDKLSFIIEQEIEHCVKKYAIPLAESLSGFVAPDPLGILDEGEIYFRSSESLLDPRTQLTYDIVTGDVILGRYPVRLASDLQKVKAVNKPELYRWPDVIIVSTKGTRSLASLLSGGDMDGDTLFMLREPDIVEPFRNQPFVPPPDDLYDANFKKHVETVRQFCERLGDVSAAERQIEFQGALLALNEDRKGLYSMLHDYAIQKYGYNHPKAIRLAYMFNTLLDASKSGLILADGIFNQDMREYSRDHGVDPSILAGQKSITKKSTHPIASSTSDAFILTKLEKAAKAKGEELKEKFRINSSSCVYRMDQDLITPYETAATFSNKNYHKYPDFDEDLRKIRDHVIEAYNGYSKAVPKHKSRTPAYVTGARMFAEPLGELAIITADQAEEIKASFAYREYHSQNVVPFQLAFQKLCEIKARSTPKGIAACTREIDEIRTIPASHIRALEKSYYSDDGDDD